MCQQEAPAVAAVHEKYGDQVNIVGIAGRAEADPIDAFINGRGVDGLHHIMDEDGSLWQTFGVASQPAWAFIDGDGNVETHFGGLGEQRLGERIDDLLS